MTCELEAVRRAADRLREAKELRSEAVRAAVGAGLSLRAVAKAAGVSHQTVANLARDSQNQ